MSTIVAWRDHAACRTAEPALFFPPEDGKSHNYTKAKEICAACPVRLDCLRYACEQSITHGLWGGLTPKARRSAAKQLRTEGAIQ